MEFKQFLVAFIIIRLCDFLGWLVDTRHHLRRQHKKGIIKSVHRILSQSACGSDVYRTCARLLIQNDIGLDSFDPAEFYFLDLEHYYIRERGV